MNDEWALLLLVQYLFYAFTAHMRKEEEKEEEEEGNKARTQQQFREASEMEYISHSKRNTYTQTYERKKKRFYEDDGGGCALLALLAGGFYL